MARPAHLDFSFGVGGVRRARHHLPVNLHMTGFNRSRGPRPAFKKPTRHQHDIEAGFR
jgi:hypothetical protein